MNGNRQDYTPQWAALRRYEAFYYVTWIGGGILALVLSTHLQSLATVFGVCWLVGTLASSLPVGSFRCPRCGKPFFSRRITAAGLHYHNGFTRKCLNCGLPKGQQFG